MSKISNQYEQMSAHTNTSQGQNLSLEDKIKQAGFSEQDMKQLIDAVAEHIAPDLYKEIHGQVQSSVALDGFQSDIEKNDPELTKLMNEAFRDDWDDETKSLVHSNMTDLLNYDERVPMMKHILQDEQLKNDFFSKKLSTTTAHKKFVNNLHKQVMRQEVERELKESVGQGVSGNKKFNGNVADKATSKGGNAKKENEASTNFGVPSSLNGSAIASGENETQDIQDLKNLAMSSINN